MTGTLGSLWPTILLPTCAGRGRIMHCLQQSLPQPDFGPACAEQIIAREIEMQADWHEDYGVATACGADIADVCAEEEVG